MRRRRGKVEEELRSGGPREREKCHTHSTPTATKDNHGLEDAQFQG